MNAIIKSLGILILLACGINYSRAQVVYNFQWNETDGQYSIYPLVTIGIGESHKLLWSCSSNTYGNIFSDKSKKENWMFYDFSNGQKIVNESDAIFSLDNDGIVKGVKEGLGALKPSCYILRANNVSFCFIKVVSEYEEKESNNDFSTANELHRLPTKASLYNSTDVDYYKFNASSGDIVTIKIIAKDANGENFGFPIFKWSVFSSDKIMTSGGSATSSEITTTAFSDVNYLEIYAHPSFLQYFEYNTYTVQVLVNGKTLGITDVSHKSDKTIKDIYSIDGHKLYKTQKGMNIYKMEDGSTKKVYVK